MNEHNGAEHDGEHGQHGDHGDHGEHKNDGSIRVVIADDERLVRTGLRVVIDAEPDLTVVGEASDGAEVVPLVRQLRPDVVLMDVRMPGIDGIRATEQLVGGMAEPPRSWWSPPSSTTTTCTTHCARARPGSC